MNRNAPLLLQYRVLFPLLAFAAVAIASETYGPMALWLASPALLIYLFAPLVPRWQVRRKLLPGRPPEHVTHRWATICQEHGVSGDLRLVAYGAANGITAGGRRGGIAAVTPEALELGQPTLDLLLRHLALQLRLVARHTARATMLWLYTSASVVFLGSYAYFTDDDVSLLGFILSLVFGLFFLFGAGGYGHQAKWAVDRRLAVVTGAAESIQSLIQQVIQRGPAYLEADVPAFSAPLWFAIPHHASEQGDQPQWDSLTQDRLKALQR